MSGKLLLSELKSYVAKEHPELIENDKIVGLVYKKSTYKEADAKIVISNPDVYDVYNQFMRLPTTAFKINPKQFTLTKGVDSILLVNQFTKYLTERHGALIKEGSIIGFTHSATAITISDQLVYDAFIAFNKDQFALKKANVQQQFIKQLNDLNTKENDSITVYGSLMSIQEDFFAKITYDLTPEALQQYIDGFRAQCNAQVDKLDKIMAPGWLFRIVEVTVKAVVGLFVGAAMVLGSVLGQGLAKKEHREKYATTFFTLHETEAQKALSQLKADTSKALDGLKKESDEFVEPGHSKPR